jgi:hypothetical protein
MSFKKDFKSLFVRKLSRAVCDQDARETLNKASRLTLDLLMSSTHEMFGKCLLN